MQHLFNTVNKATPQQKEHITMTLFALVEVVMIIVGIVLANHFEKQKELADIREDALVLFLAVLDDLELDILNSERIILRNVRHNITSDVLMDPHSSAEDLELNLPYLEPFELLFKLQHS